MRVYDLKVPPRTDLVTTAQVLTKGPALIVGVAISGTGSTPYAIVYDGANANGRMVLHLDCAQNTGWSPVIRGGIECLTGIYVAPDATTTYVTIQWYPADEVAGSA